MARKMHRRSGKRKSSRSGTMKKKHSYSKRYHRKGRGKYESKTHFFYPLSYTA